ncbi:MAG TPA: hypothetical protein VH021_21930 [Trebonia sp.]|nr:hypothetical protein [Trebonia sp.]
MRILAGHPGYTAVTLPNIGTATGCRRLIAGWSPPRGAGGRCGQRADAPPGTYGGAKTIIAGHRKPQAPDDDARRQIDDCRRYLADANPYTLWVAAYDLLG